MKKLTIFKITIFCAVFISQTISAQNYTETGTNISWDELKTTLSTSSSSAGGSTIDVVNSELETGYGATPLNPDIVLHVLSDSFTDKTSWKRWFQTDGNTQIFRLFTGEYSIIDSRGGHPRIEAFTTGANVWKYDATKWHVFKAKYTPIYIANGACIFQAKNTVNDWALQLGCSSSGNITYQKRWDGTSTVMGSGMMGKSFEIMVKDDGKNYELYYNDVFQTRGSYTRSEGSNQFRWGFYLTNAMSGNNMMFVSGATFYVVDKEVATSGATYTWNQTGTASFTTPSNWTPERTTPLTSDILEFNNSDSVIVTDVPTQTISGLSISNNTSVELQSAAASVLSIQNTEGTDFEIQTGSKLKLIQSAFPVSLSLTSLATGVIGGNVIFQSNAHKLTGIEANAIRFLGGSSFTAGVGFSSNPFGTGALKSIVFESGSIYYYIAGSNPFGTSASQTSAVTVFQTGSKYIHKATTLPFVANRVYADFELDAPTTAATSNPNSYPLTVDNFIVKSGMWNLGIKAAFNVKGNITVASGSTLNLTPSTAGTLVFSGTIPQTITNNGTLTINSNSKMSVTNPNPLVINNSLGATLNAAASLPGTLNNSGTFNLTGMSTTLSGTINQVIKDASTSAVITAPSGASIDVKALTMNVTLADGYSPAMKDSAILINIPLGTITDNFASLSLPSSDWKLYNTAGRLEAKFENNTAVSNTYTDKSVFVENGKLVINGSAEVYNTVGLKVASIKIGNGETALTLRPGIYIVKTNFGTQKVMIK